MKKSTFPLLVLMVLLAMVQESSSTKAAKREFVADGLVHAEEIANAVPNPDGPPHKHFE